MGHITPFWADDQPLVDRLCTIIRQLDNQIGDGAIYYPQKFEDAQTQELYDRIIQED